MTALLSFFIGNPPMNFLKASVAPENGHSRVSLGDQSLVAPAALSNAVDGDVLVDGVLLVRNGKLTWDDEVALARQQRSRGARS